MTVLPRSVTFVCAALAVAGVVFAAVTEGLLVSPVRTAVAFMSILLGVVFMVSIAPVFDHRRPPAAAVAQLEPSPAPAHNGMLAFLEQLYPDSPTEPAASAPTTDSGGLRLVDLDTGELVGDRVTRLEERVDTLTREMVDLGAVVEDQAQLTARAFGTLRREVERITHVFAEAEPDAG